MAWSEATTGAGTICRFAATSPRPPPPPPPPPPAAPCAAVNSGRESGKNVQDIRRGHRFIERHPNPRLRKRPQVDLFGAGCVDDPRQHVCGYVDRHGVEELRIRQLVAEVLEALGERAGVRVHPDRKSVV